MLLSPRARTLALIVAVGTGLMCFFPPAYLILHSVAGRWSFPDLFPDGYDPQRWLAFWRDERGLASSLAISLAISTVVATIATIAGYLAGRHVAYHRRRRGLLLLAYLPFVISPVVAAVCLLYFYIKIGLSGGIAGVIAAQLLFTTGFAIVFFQGFWNERKRALEDLARTLGGSRLQIYRRVLLPMSRQMLTLCFFQTFLVSWFQYGLTLLIGSGRVRTLPLRVYDYLAEANISYAALGSCLLVAPAVVMLWTGRWIQQRGARDVS